MVRNNLYIKTLIHLLTHCTKLNGTSLPLSQGHKVKEKILQLGLFPSIGKTNIRLQQDYYKLKPHPKKFCTSIKKEKRKSD